MGNPGGGLWIGAPGRPVGHPKDACSGGNVEMNPVSFVCFVLKRTYVVLCLYLRGSKKLLEWICVYIYCCLYGVQYMGISEARARLP